MKRKPADKSTEFVPDMLKVLRSRELSVTLLAAELGQDFPHRVRRWVDALAEQGLLRHRIVRDSRNSPVGVYTLAKTWGGELDR
jgi:hypothetical protein